MVLRLMLINSVFWKPQFQGGVLKIGGDVRENSGPEEYMGTLGICHLLLPDQEWSRSIKRGDYFSKLVKLFQKWVFGAGKPGD